jgi:DNA-binding GntR family transcriptional regulator
MSVSLVEEAYLAIRDEILGGRSRPGTPLSRRRLARQLGMSVLPVSGALKRLEEDGLVETRARAGTRVKVPTRTDVRELYELREALESQAARLFAERATAVHRRELRRLAGHVDALFDRLAAGGERLAAGGNDNGFRFDVHKQHVQFHMWIAEHANSRLLQQMIERKHVLILNWMFDITARRTPLPPGFHSRLAEGLVSGDVEKADALMREHVRYGFAEISRHIGALGASEWRERRHRQSNGARHT